jgi:hypothetical protein
MKMTKTKARVRASAKTVKRKAQPVRTTTMMSVTGQIFVDTDPAGVAYAVCKALGLPQSHAVVGDGDVNIYTVTADAARLVLYAHEESSFTHISIRRKGQLLAVMNVGAPQPVTMSGC